MLTIPIQQQPDIVAHYQQQWKICPTCWHINEMPVHFCKQCRQGLDGYICYSLQEIGQQWGIRVCPNCLSKYGVSVLTCNSCNFATELVAQRKVTPPPPCNDEIPSSCDRCRVLQGSYYLFCDQCGRMLRFPFSYNTDRPTIPLTLGYATNQVQCNGLVDTGASYNLFHGDIAVILGIDLTSAQTLIFSGIVAGATITGYQATVQLGLLGAFYETVMYFSFDLSPASPGLLGKVGFFDRFIVELNSANRDLVVRESPLLERRVYQHCPQCLSDRATPTSSFCPICGTSLLSPATSNGYIVPHRQAQRTNLLPPPPA